MVVRWNSDDDVDLNAVIFDSSVNLIDVAYFGDREKLDGRIKISDDVRGATSGTENMEALVGQWDDLFEEKSVGFIAVVIHVFQSNGMNGGNLSQIPGCKVGCECKSTVFWQFDCSDAQGPG